MKKHKYARIIVVLLMCVLTLTTSNFEDRATAQPVATQTPAPAEVTKTNPQIKVLPLVLVNSPSSYLNKTVVMDAKFDKFSTLGLDYKTAFRSSEDYISFLIKRDDTDHNIPLSEMKLFLKRTDAEKHIDLKTDDRIRIVGQVFSDALGDTWIDVTQLTITEKAPEKDGVK
ncbi:MAG: hypothetical protein MJ237_04080 [bacterium]|nr:hypothetical protein [bacterium]